VADDTHEEPKVYERSPPVIRQLTRDTFAPADVRQSSAQRGYFRMLSRRPSTRCWEIQPPLRTCLG